MSLFVVEIAYEIIQALQIEVQGLICVCNNFDYGKK